jgi:hypothetical protein
MLRQRTVVFFRKVTVANGTDIVGDERREFGKGGCKIAGVRGNPADLCVYRREIFSSNDQFGSHFCFAPGILRGSRRAIGGALLGRPQKHQGVTIQSFWIGLREDHIGRQLGDPLAQQGKDIFELSPPDLQSAVRLEMRVSQTGLILLRCRSGAAVGFTLDGHDLTPLIRQGV